jgi:hypothetical protein
VIELVMYTPLLVFAMLVIIQAALLFLGNQAVGAAAREASRVARAASDTGSPGGSDEGLRLGAIRGRAYANSVGHGLITNPEVRFRFVPGPGGQQLETTVSAQGVRLIPGLPWTQVVQVVQGPVEEFRPDGGV